MAARIGWLTAKSVTLPVCHVPYNRPMEGTYLSWLKARAAKVETTVPSAPVIVHQGFWIRSPMKMMSPLRGLLTNTT